MDRAAAEQSLVNIIRDGVNCGMGFLAPGDRVITARHCIAHVLDKMDRTVRLSKFLEPAVAADAILEWFDEDFNFDVYLRRRAEGWASGTARLIEDDQPMVEIRNDPPVLVHQGTSGTPVFDDTGAGVGVAMLSAADAQAYEGLDGGGEDRPPVFSPLASVLAFMRDILNPPPAEQPPEADADEDLPDVPQADHT